MNNFTAHLLIQLLVLLIAVLITLVVMCLIPMIPNLPIYFTGQFLRRVGLLWIEKWQSVKGALTCIAGYPSWRFNRDPVALLSLWTPAKLSFERLPEIPFKTMLQDQVEVVLSKCYSDWCRILKSA
jgi:hypothetical protein